MRIGRHMPTNSKPVRAAQIARQIGCNAIQIFASNPTGWRPPSDDATTSMAFAEAARVCELDPVVIHAPYLINLGTLDATIWEKSVTLLSWTLRRGLLLGAKYVVFHTGSHRGAGVEAGIARIAEGIAAILPQTPPEVMLLLENDVGAGNSLGRNFEQLGAVLNLLPEYRERLGICLDTAHLWGAGYDISNAPTTLQMLDSFDAKMALGSHRDVHARLDEGIIGDEGLRAMLNDPRLTAVTVLLETPIKTDDNDKEDWVHDAGQIARAKGLIGRRQTSVEQSGPSPLM